MNEVEVFLLVAGRLGWGCFPCSRRERPSGGEKLLFLLSFLPAKEETGENLLCFTELLGVKARRLAEGV
jgi:hypothetical protein